MTAYRRLRIPGATWFFTVNLSERRNNRLLTDNIDGLKGALRKVKTDHPFTIDAIVILPDHIHCIWTLPPDDSDYSNRWTLIKTGFSRALAHGEQVSVSRRKRGERGIWQRRFWEHLIRDDRDYERHVDYIHWNPVKHGWVRRVMDWEHSSFHRFVERGIYPSDWSTGLNETVEAGE
ncbi:MAG: transposase [Candidatus Thiosymbion ectosymbiont of Robbea hypermnestra]|nr:transposase [Candidatus Thiosymbion ectosymbiont of Robbea hypermnestra]